MRGVTVDQVRNLIAGIDAEDIRKKMKSAQARVDAEQRVHEIMALYDIKESIALRIIHYAATTDCADYADLMLSIDSIAKRVTRPETGACALSARVLADEAANAPLPSLKSTLSAMHTALNGAMGSMLGSGR